MAVATESFSIREYTERMRSVDLRRCWPFGVGSGDALSLPSISVRRFKWWSDELGTARSEAGVEEEHVMDKQAADFEISEGDDIPHPARMAVEESAALPTGEDARRSVKGKQKAPKKRSIVELFAAAPLIAGAVDDVEEDSGVGDSPAEEGEGGGRGVVPEETEMNVVIREKKGMREANLKKKRGRKKRKKKGLKLEIRALEKKKARKGKSFQKHKALQTSKPFSMNNDVAKKLPVRSILKNKKKSSKIVSTKAANLIKLYCESNKHVTFSVKDDILGSSRACSTMDCPQMHNLCKIFSDVLAASSAINHSTKGYDPIEPNDKPKDVNSCENGTHKTEVSSTDCKNQSTVVNSSNSSCSGTEKASFAVMVDLNHAIEANDFDSFIPDASTLSSSCTYSGDPTSRVTTHEKNQNSTSVTLFESGLPSPSEPILMSATHDDLIALSEARTSPTPKECQPHVDAGISFYRQIEDQSTKGLLSGICYSMGSKQIRESLFAPDSVSTCKSKCSGEDFIGLPLNSQGELIQFHSGTKFNEAYKKQNINLGSTTRKIHPEMTKKKFIGAPSYQKNYYSTKERVRHWLNFAELDGSKRKGTQRSEPTKGNNDRFLNCNSNPKSNFGYPPPPAVQPTMRLMGKNVVVGGINGDCHAFTDRRTLKKIENFAGQTRFSMFPEKSLPQQWMQRESVPHPAIGRSKGNAFQLTDSTPKFYNSKSFDPSFDYTHAHQPRWISRSNDNHIFTGDVEKHGLPSQAFLNNSTQFLGNYTLGEGAMSMEHHYNHGRILFPGAMNPHFGNFPQPQPLHTTEKLPPWLLNAQEHKRNQISDSHYSHLLKKSTSMKKKDMMDGTYSNFKAPVDAVRKLGKRPAVFEDGITNPTKRSLKGKEVSNGVYGCLAGSSSSRFDNELRSGPTKLIGGAKHILKPCQMIDDENCRPIHSTIIFPGTAASLGAEKKFANIYKF